MSKVKPPYAEAKRAFKKFPQVKKTVADKQRESVPLERRERRALGLSAGSYRTVDRLLIYDQPTNKDARNAILPPRQREHKPSRSVFIYLARFTSLLDDRTSFLKIGITNDISGRFDWDIYRYKRETLGSVSGLTRSEALKIERRIHRIFAEKSHLPKMKLLSRGNTECFDDEQSLIDAVIQIFSLIEDAKKHAGIAQM